MNVTVIVLIVVGIIAIAISCFISEQLIANKEEEKKAIEEDFELSEEEQAIIKDRLSRLIDQYVDDTLVDTKEQLDTMTNEKTLALGDYAVTVYEEIEKNHNEVTFLYSMLNDKQKELMTLVQEIYDIKESINQIKVDSIAFSEKANNNEEIHSNKNQSKEASLETKQEKVKPQKNTEINLTDENTKIQDYIDIEDEENISYDKDFEEIDSMNYNLDDEIAALDDEPDSINDIVLELYKSGMNIIEIAKQLGLGVGEVKLIVDLYKGE